MGSDPSSPETREELRERWIERLVREVDLPAFLVARGFHLAPSQPEPDRLALTGEGSQALLLQRDVDRRAWTYTNPADPEDRGTIADLIIKRDGVSREACLQRLVSCLDRSSDSPEGRAYRQALRSKPDELWRAQERHIAGRRVAREAIRSLENLGVAPGTLDEWRFGSVKDGRDVQRLLADPTTLEHSRYRPTDRQLVLIERPIDALAYERAHGQGRACYVYTGDRPDPVARRRVAHLFAYRPGGLGVVLAFGRDERGHTLSAEIERLLPGVKARRQVPEFGGRWSDQMQIEWRHARSLERIGQGIKR
jgi:hypothetical protein